jgi:ankyrin repeat protein
MSYPSFSEAQKIQQQFRGTVFAKLGQKEKFANFVADGMPVDAVDPNGSAALACAAGSGKKDMVLYLIESGAEVARVNPQGESALYLAIQSREVECARVLLEAGAPVDGVTAHGKNALHAAATVGSIPLIDAVLDHGPAELLNVATKDERLAYLDGLTALGWATYSRQDAAGAHLAARQGTNILAANGQGQSPLHHAAKHGLLEAARAIVAAAPTAVEARDEEGATPIHWAAREDQADVLSFLLSTEKGAGLLNDQDTARGYTPLHAAAKGGASDAAKVLCRAGADKAARDKHGDVPDRVGSTQKVRTTIQSNFIAAK